MHSESPPPYPLQFFDIVWGNSANGRAQNAIETVRPSIQDIVPPPPPIVGKRRSSSSVKGVLVKRKSESQGGDVKRRRSSVTESPRIEKSPSIPSPSPTSTKPIIASSPTNTTLNAASVKPAAPKNGSPKGGLVGFEHYSDSDDDSE